MRLDVDAGRWREAALGLRVALEAALAELEPWREAAGLAGRLAELREHDGEVGAVADAALQGGLDDAQIALVGAVLGARRGGAAGATAGGCEPASRGDVDRAAPGSRATPAVTSSASRERLELLLDVAVEPHRRAPVVRRRPLRDDRDRRRRARSVIPGSCATG